MELMGQWAPSVQKDQSADKKGLGDKLGWFAFPSVDGGAGAATDGVGGGNGIAVGKDAPPEAIDFLKFFNARREPDQAQHRQRRPLDDRRHRGGRHRPEPAGGPRRPRGCAVHAAVPRPGDGGHRDGPGVQRRDRGAVPGASDRRRRARRSPTPRPPSRPQTCERVARRLHDESGPAPAGPLDSTPMARTADDGFERPQRGTRRRAPVEVADDRAVPRARAWRSTWCSSCSRSSRPPTSACTSGTASTPLTDFIGLKNYQVALSSDGFGDAIGNNLLIIFLSLAIQIPFSLALAVMLNRRFRGPGHVPAAVLPARTCCPRRSPASCSGCCSSRMPSSTRRCHGRRGSTSWSRTGWATPRS